jgi:hypothetical protein
MNSQDTYINWRANQNLNAYTPPEEWDNTWTLYEKGIVNYLINKGYTFSIASMYIYWKRGMKYEDYQMSILKNIDKTLIRWEHH